MEGIVKEGSCGTKACLLDSGRSVKGGALKCSALEGRIALMQRF